MNYENGVVLYINKPLQWTSFDVVNKTRYMLRRALSVKKIKVGHAGTLDPLATGVMIVCVGKETKNIDTYTNHDKEYVATIKLGATTPSYDKESEEDAQYPIDHITKDLLEQSLQQFVGEFDQIPPVFSAIRVNGRHAYELARQNKDVKMKPRKIKIYEIELLDVSLPYCTFRVSCSKGTYIRSLAHDIGKTLNSGAYLTNLVRTKVGTISIDDCITLEQLQENINKEIIEQEISI